MKSIPFAIVRFDNMVWEGPAHTIREKFRSFNYGYEGTDLRGCTLIEVYSNQRQCRPERMHWYRYWMGDLLPTLDWRQYVEPIRRKGVDRR